MDWHVELVWNCGTTVDEDIADELMVALSHVHPAITIEGPKLSVALSINADNARAALTVGADTAERALGDLNVQLRGLSAARVLSETELHDRLYSPLLPSLVGVAEIAQELSTVVSVSLSWRSATVFRGQSLHWRLDRFGSRIVSRPLWKVGYGALVRVSGTRDRNR